MLGKNSGLERLSESFLSIEQIRRVDELAIEQYGMHSLVLMENAALGCVESLLRKFAQPPLRTSILCGKGNNGGDGLAIARHLVVRGWDCEVYLFGQPNELSPDAFRNYEVLTIHDGLKVKIVDDLALLPLDFSASELILDALLGTGAKGDPRPPMDTAIAACNRSAAYRVAIDNPTGINAENGQIGQPSFNAHATLTFVAKKPAMRAENLRLFGEIAVLPIGIPQQLIDAICPQ